jgi:hypothetical protein
MVKYPEMSIIMSKSINLVEKVKLIHAEKFHEELCVVMNVEIPEADSSISETTRSSGDTEETVIDRILFLSLFFDKHTF